MRLAGVVFTPNSSLFLKLEFWDRSSEQGYMLNQWIFFCEIRVLWVRESMFW